MRVLAVLTALVVTLASETAALEPQSPVLSGRERCTEAGEVTIFVSPRSPAAGRPLRVIAVSDRPLEAVLAVAAPDETPLVLAPERRGGPPYWWYAEATAGRPGTYRAGLGDGADLAACRDVTVDGSPSRGARPAGGVWSIERGWEQATENLFAAWIEKLFDDPLGAQPSWRALDEVTREPARNFLHDHLGLGEDDERGLRLVPDCADLPYLLRAYFAWKLGLPFGYSACTRGGKGRPPACGRWHSNLEPEAGDALSRMQRFVRRVADVIHSGAGRTAGEDDRSDLYPTRLSPERLRPGTVYADPYGHTLVLVRRVPQTPSSGGLLLAVDAQPDGTVARKRYWRGNFLFALDPSLGGPGFKGFRPIVRRGDGLRPLTNREIAAHPDYGDWSLEQYGLGVEGFYDRIDEILSPEPFDPARALRETIDALDEQVRARIRSVANGEAYLATRGGTIPMPEGAAIFETTGPWEDYATPARDLRLLIAIDVVRRFPEKVVGRPARFAMPAGRAPGAVRAELEALLAAESAARRFEYRRSDGSPWTLTLADVMARAETLEMAYNPNDCVEVRWGAPRGSEEVATCRRHAPAEQVARMAGCRSWFHERRRPPR
jgi:hypothetical protein